MNDLQMHTRVFALIISSLFVSASISMSRLYNFDQFRFGHIGVEMVIDDDKDADDDDDNEMRPQSRKKWAKNKH